MSYQSVRREMAGHAEAFDRLPCAWCREPTLRETLSLYGARCPRCYAAYCREAGTDLGPLTVADQREILEHMRTAFAGASDPRAWVQRLLDRQATGERLSAGQIAALAAVMAT